MGRRRAVEPNFAINAKLPAVHAHAVVNLARARGVGISALIRLALTEVTGLPVATARDRSKLISTIELPIEDATTASAELVDGPPVLIACVMPISMADRVIAEAQARKITTAGLIRYALTTAMGLPTAQPKDYPAEAAPEQTQMTIDDAPTDREARPRRPRAA